MILRQNNIEKKKKQTNTHTHTHTQTNKSKKETSKHNCLSFARLDHYSSTNNVKIAMYFGSICLSSIITFFLFY